MRILRASEDIRCLEIVGSVVEPAQVIADKGENDDEQKEYYPGLFHAVIIPFKTAVVYVTMALYG